ncbi:MAG: PQQ-like beta-propeller repeat protein [Verrucomicrobiae bacterium]|nr:PQQ-like beta-propeller repeat protein [Verrucomicrobiae bacterium]
MPSAINLVNLMMHYSSSLLALLTAAACASFVGAEDWPQWQGPQRNNLSKETGLLKEWPKEGPPLAWKATGLGGGDSTPSVAAGRIYGMANRGEDEVVWALNEKDGKEIWAARLGPAYNQRMTQSREGPACTPTVDGNRLYVVGLGGEVACLQTSDGKILWQRSLTRDFGGRVPAWSYRESPLVDGDKVIVTPGAPDAMLVALNKMTGETLWKTTVPQSTNPPPAEGGPPGPGGGRRGGMGGGGAAYASAIAIEVEGQRQYVQFTARGVIGVAAADGKLLWRYDKPANGMGINCSTPIYQDGLVFAASAYGAGGGAVKLSKDAAGNWTAEEVYFTRRMQNHHGGMVVLDGCLYGANGGNEGGYLACLNFKTGEVLWDARDLPERPAPKGSVAYADGRIYYRTERGTVLLIEPNAKEYRERGRFEQPDRTRLPAWAHPVIANGKLYLRDQETLYCYDIQAK